MQQTIRLPQPDLAAPLPWAAGPADPFPQPGGDGQPVVDPYAPAAAEARGPGAGVRVAGVVVGLLLGLGGFVGLLVGQASTEGNQTRGLWFGLGLLLLAGAALLGSWTAATPITAGVVGAAPGLFGVIAPVTWSDTVGRLPEIDLGFDLAGISASDAIAAFGSYSAAAAGVLLVVGGVTTVLGRRKGAARPV